jgi:hypothetical protein
MKLNQARRLRRVTMRLVLGLAPLVGIVVPSLSALAFPQRCFVLINEAESAALRSDLVKPGWKADLHRGDRGLAITSSSRGVRANAELWLKRSVAIPACGGHFHHFFCVDGDQLKVPKDQHFVPGP